MGANDRPMIRKLSVEIWGVADGQPASVSVLTDDGNSVVLDAAARRISVRADDVIHLARMLEGMRTPPKRD